MSHLSFPQQVQVISLLTEGMSIRAVSRLTGVHCTTIMQLAQRVGKVHTPLRVTPAMEAGLTPSIWSIGDLIDYALSTPPDTLPPQLLPTPTYPLPGRQFVRRYVGGRGRFR